MQRSPVSVSCSMNTVNAIRERLISELEAAFRDIQRGAGMTLFEADLEGTRSEADLRWARSRDTYATWQEIPDDVIARYFSALGFLDPEGFRYYIPAFMRFSLRHFDDSHSPSIDWAIYAFCSFGSQPDYCEPRFMVFNEQQAQAICRFLRFMAQYTDGQADDAAACQALQNYWGQFCDGVS
jgi:hypothetical protein